MPDLIDNFGDPDRTPTSRTLTKLAHALPVVALLLYPTRLAADLFPATVPQTLALASGLGMVPIALIATFHQELGRICVSCMQEVPADPGKLVTQLRLLLRLSHWSPVRYLVIWAALFLPGMVATIVAGVGWSWIFILCDTLFFAAIMAGWAHHRLRPWCPYCRDWDGDDSPHERVPNPDPAGVKST